MEIITRWRASRDFESLEVAFSLTATSGEFKEGSLLSYAGRANHTPAPGGCRNGAATVDHLPRISQQK
jgi:hypothetical protein